MEARYSILFSNFYYKKALQSGLWLVWLCGFFLICVSFYATQLLPKKHKVFNDGVDDLSGPKITLFTAPRPFTGLIGERQALAVRSWLGLSENINVVLFSQDPSVFSFADSLGSRVSVEPNIDFTFLGTAFFHSMVARSLASSSDVSALIDSDTVLLSDFVSTLNNAHKLDEDWLLIAATQNISHFPFHLDSDGKRWLADDDKHVRIKKLQDFLPPKSCGKPFGEGTIIAWNNGDLPLHKGVLPPFLYGKGLHNQWIINEALNSDFRLVIDGSSTISSFHLNDLYQENHLSSRSWELNGNSLMGRIYGSFSFRNANYSSLLMLFEREGHYLFVNENQNIAYVLGCKRSLNLWKKGAALSPLEEEIQGCIDSIKSPEGIEGRLVNEPSRLWTSIRLPFSLENLLSIRADQNKTIVLGVAGYSYKDMLMSWVCRLRHLQLSNFLVCALDNEIYEFSILQGLPVIKFSNPPTNISFDDCHFGTECFQKVTKVKSRMALKILKLGYNVLLSDVDVYWFENPLPYLSSFGPAVLVAQSDEYNTAGPINLPRRLNSGFYYAHSDIISITALEKVVKHAANSNFSEQPSFYDTLCGEGGSNRLDDNHCLEPETNLLVHFLNRDLFPNGAYVGLWEEKDIKKICMDKGCLVLHNNWISGRKKKLERQVFSGLWEYDINTRMCLQSWQRSDIPTLSFGAAIGSFDKILNKYSPSRKKQKAFLPPTKLYQFEILEPKKFPDYSYYKHAHALCTKFCEDLGDAEEMCSCLWASSVKANNSKRREELQDETISFRASTHLKALSVRVVHAGGQIELYQSAVSASTLIQKYPGMCITRPNVFKRPYESLLSADDILLPGHKYYVIRSTTVEKLMRRFSQKGRINDPGGSSVPILKSKEVEDVGDDLLEESIGSARDFYICKDTRSSSLVKKKLKERRPFVPPIQRPKWKEPEWEPSLNSIQEISP